MRKIISKCKKIRQSVYDFLSEYSIIRKGFYPEIIRFRIPSFLSECFGRFPGFGPTALPTFRVPEARCYGNPGSHLNTESHRDGVISPLIIIMQYLYLFVR